MPNAGILAILAWATSIRRALTEGALYLPKRLAYDLDPMAPGTRQR
ncbi:hypothetical protein [Bacillus sp. REN16]|nr:hypothetical protein [Bacillus sp. REN16]MCC3356307.1 hypothetical protein [Bacillus sp. REN16]